MAADSVRRPLFIGNVRCVLVLQREGDGLGRILVIEFKDQESAVFNAVMDLLKHHSNFVFLQPREETVVSIPGLEIYPKRRKVFRDQREINLTTKEYSLFTKVFLQLYICNKDTHLFKERSNIHFQECYIH